MKNVLLCVCLECGKTVEVDVYIKDKDFAYWDCPECGQTAKYFEDLFEEVSE